MRENEPVLLVLSVFDVKLFLRRVKFYLRNVTFYYQAAKASVFVASLPLNRHKPGLVPHHNLIALVSLRHMLHGEDPHAYG
jgi:hypothetical protein